MASLASLLVWLACAQPHVDLPEPPDMSAWLTRYEGPSAPLDANTVAAILKRQQEVTEQIEGASGLAVVLDALFALAGSSDTSQAALRADAGEGLDTLSRGLRVGSLTVHGQGFLRLARICRGWHGGATPDPADGSITLTATFTDAGFDPVVWGQVQGCREQDGERRLRLDGDVRLHTGGFLAGAPDAVILLAYEGRTEVDEQDDEVAFSLRAPITGAWVEVDLTLDTGNVVFFATQPGSATAPISGFRAANGTWTCDWEAGTCTRDGEQLALW